ncbi:MAG: hypothetical protein LBP58_07490 [Azoarcus sp.]|jgi:pyruvate/2-oxoglutarate dehydrogenase complex dihydrolipoamide acyltransferase (E2) component|nr:hypothetical protein [Azoarcus sp.]
MTLRIDFKVSKDQVSNLIEENITALVDPDDHHFVYEAVIDGQPPEITYEQTRDNLIAKARNTASTFSGPVFWLISIALIIVGGAGSVLRQKLLKEPEPAQEPAAAEPAQEPATAEPAAAESATAAPPQEPVAAEPAQEAAASEPKPDKS